MTTAFYIMSGCAVLCLIAFAVMWRLYDHEYDRAEDAISAAKRLASQVDEIQHEYDEISRAWNSLYLEMQSRKGVNHRGGSTKTPGQDCGCRHPDSHSDGVTNSIDKMSIG